MKHDIQFKDILDLSLTVIEQISRADEMGSYQIICHEITHRMGWDYAEIWLRDSKHLGLVPSNIYTSTDGATQNFAKSEKKNIYLIEEGFPGLTLKFKKPIWFSKIMQHPQFDRKSYATNVGFQTCLSIPFIVEDYVDAVLLCFSKKDIAEDEEFMSCMSILSSHIGLDMLKKQLERLNNPNFCSEDQSVDIISKIFGARDPYTKIHESSVKSFAKKLAECMSFSDQEKHDISIASSLHDIGKIGIPMEILSKPSRLSDQEYELIKTHVKIGYKLIEDLSYSNEAKRMVLEHHERLDGSGYPQGLKGDQIYIGSQLLAVADVVSAMLENRPYRIAHDEKVVIDEVKKYAGIKYNEEISAHAIHLIKLQMKENNKDMSKLE